MIVEKLPGLRAHVAVDAFENGDREFLTEDGFELFGPDAEGLFDAEQLREILQQIRGGAVGQIEPGVDGSQFDLLLGATRVDECVEAMPAEDGADRTRLRLLAPV